MRYNHNLFNKNYFAKAQLVGERPERVEGVGPPLQNEKKDWRISLSQELGIIKSKELL